MLELGTFSGYSALCIAEGLQPGATIDTIEVDDELEDFILQNISMSPDADKVRLHIGDALEVMKQWDDNEFDLIFMMPTNDGISITSTVQSAFSGRGAS